MDLYSDVGVNDPFIYNGDDDTADRASTTSSCELSVYRQLFIIYSSAYTSDDKNLQAYNEGWVRIVLTTDGNEQLIFELSKDK